MIQIYNAHCPGVVCYLQEITLKYLHIVYNSTLNQMNNPVILIRSVVVLCELSGRISSQSYYHLNNT